MIRRSTLLGLLCLGFVGCGGAPETAVPTWTVEAGPFEHRVTAEGRLQATRSTKLSVPAEVDQTIRVAWLAREGTRLQEGDVVARFDAKALEEDLEDGRRELSGAEVEMEWTDMENRGELRKLEKDLQLAELELTHAEEFQKTDAEVFSRRDIQEDAIDQYLAADRKAHAEASTETRRSLARTEIDLLDIRRRRAQDDLDRARRGMESLEITAPHPGLLTLIRDWRGEPPRVGMEMWRGQKIGEIPDLSEMEAQVYVLEADAGGLGEGKDAEVVIEAFPDRTFPATIKGLEAMAKPRFRGSPVQYFGVVLGFEKTDPEVMKPGGRVRATLLLERREEAVVIPRQGIFRQGAETKVYVQKGGRFEPRTVRIGPTSLGSAVVEEGLAPGEVIALALPPGVDESEAQDGNAVVEASPTDGPAAGGAEP